MRQLQLLLLVSFQAADITSDMDETLKSSKTRLSNVENDYRIFQPQDDRLTQEKAALGTHLTYDIADLNEIKQEISALKENNNRLNELVDHLTKKIGAVEQENSRLNEELLNRQDARLTNVRPNAMRNLTSSNHEPYDSRSQFTAFACTNNTVTLLCHGGRTIRTETAYYGQHHYFCTDFCAPNPHLDCTELVEENRPSDWVRIKALCDGKASCEFENLGSVINDCYPGYLSDYMQLFYNCLPDDETGPVAFTAYANTGYETDYSGGAIIVFNEILTNAGGHYNNATSSFICPWHGLYVVSVNVQGYPSDHIQIAPKRNSVSIGLMIIDDISGFHNRGSTTFVTECDRGDILWVGTGSFGAIYTHPHPMTLFTVHLIHRY